MSKAIEDTHLQ
uniref:Uncharacterized protein n=1 Tax=Moniliophthora roreri TaxID=221103 RepID=A0A0W0F604_MONRR